MRVRFTLCGLFAALAAGALYGAIALDRISADSLRANITWLAADQRQGRMTPSAGLDASADYLAAQFRSAGLSPIGPDENFFQTAAFVQVADFRMTLDAGTRHLVVNRGGVSADSLVALDFRDEAVVRLPYDGPLAGQVVACDEATLESLEARKPAMILLAMNGPKPKQSAPELMEADPSLPPVIRIYDSAARALFTGGSDVKLTLHLRPPAHYETARNVAGMLRGSDPAVREEFVIVSAHYDHLGMRPPGPGNRVFHGANDNAGGAASLIEIAKALSAEPHPGRSVLFLALFGEEEGLLGSEFYVRHPLAPIARTVADINLEQLGRTDSSDGPEIARFAFTGPDYSDLPRIMGAAAAGVGDTVYRKDTADEYFDRSDNYSFAQAGIVAHTVVVAFEFPDYHAVSDQAAKLDYANLAKVDRGIAAGVAAVANAVEAPKWSNAKGARAYRMARRSVDK